MAYLGRPGATAPLTTADIPDDSITAAKIVDGAVTSDLVYLENTTTTQNLSGTYSTERMYLNDSYTLTGDVTVTGHLALGTIADSDIVITQDSTERTITGSGTLESGELLSSKQTDLTGMTGELGNVTFPAGHIIQVVQDTLVTANCFTSGQGDWTDIGLELDITPAKTGNKIWIQAVVNVGVETGRDAKARCFRDDTTDILVATGMGGSRVSSFGALGADTDSESHDRVYPLILNFVDSPTIPSTPIAINYKIQLYHASSDDGDTICYNRSYLDTDAQRSARVSSTLIVMELSS